MNENKQICVNGVNYTFKELFDVNLTLSYENDNWEEWHILREFISNALDSVRGDTSRISIQTDVGFITIRDTGDGYPLVYAKRIGASNKRDDAELIGNFGEGVKLSLLACVRKGIKVLLLSRNWLIEPKAVLVDDQFVLMYSIYESEASITGTSVIIEANIAAMEIIDNLKQYFLQFRNDSDCLHGDINNGIFPMIDQKAMLYNKGVFIKEISALYSYGVNLEGLNRDRDLISHSNIAWAIKSVWNNVDNPCLIKTLITASTLHSSERDKLAELYYTVSPVNLAPWAAAFTELFGYKALLYTNDLAEREAVALGYDVISCDYRIADILQRAGIKNDTETLSDNYEFRFTDRLEQDEAEILNRVYALAELLGADIPKNVKIFDEYANHPDILGIYNQRSKQVYMRKNVLAAGLEEALSVFLHEANHHISGSDDVSRKFADSLCQMLSNLLLRYASEVGIKSTVQINQTEIILPSQLPAVMSVYANVISIGNRMYIYTPVGTVEVELPIILASPVCVMKKLIVNKQRLTLKLPGKLIAALEYSSHDTPLSCIVKINGLAGDSYMQDDIHQIGEVV